MHSGQGSLDSQFMVAEKVGGSARPHCLLLCRAAAAAAAAGGGGGGGDSPVAAVATAAAAARVSNLNLYLVRSIQQRSRSDETLAVVGRVCSCCVADNRSFPSSLPFDTRFLPSFLSTPASFLPSFLPSVLPPGVAGGGGREAVEDEGGAERQGQAQGRHVRGARTRVLAISE